MRVTAMDVGGIGIGAAHRLPPEADVGGVRFVPDHVDLPPHVPVGPDLPAPAADVAVAMTPDDVTVHPQNGRLDVIFEITNDRVEGHRGIAADPTVEVRVDGEVVHREKVVGPQPGEWTNERVTIRGLDFSGKQQTTVEVVITDLSTEGADEPAASGDLASSQQTLSFTESEVDDGANGTNGDPGPPDHIQLPFGIEVTERQAAAGAGLAVVYVLFA